MMNNPSWDITLQSIIWVWSCGSVVRFSLSWLLMIHFWLENILDIILFPTYTAMSSTAKILAAITLAIPTGETHMIASTILMITWRKLWCWRRCRFRAIFRPGRLCQKWWQAVFQSCPRSPGQFQRQGRRISLQECLFLAWTRVHP